MAPGQNTTLILFGVCMQLVRRSLGASAGWPRLVRAAGVSPNKTEVHLIGLQAYSGGPGTVGYKTEPMIQLALEQIESHPTLLPNHTLVLHFVDSACSGTRSTDVVFEQHVVAPKKFGVWGAGCSGACMAASDVTRNFKTTHLAHLCTGTELSDETSYPEFARFTPDLDKNAQVAADIGGVFEWKRIAVVMENQGLFTSMGEALANKIRDDPDKDLISFEKIFPMATDLEWNLDIQGVVGRLIDAEARVILFVGYERTMARLSCEAYKRGFYGPKVVMVYATFWINADWYQEFAHVTRCTADEVLAGSQGLLGIDRLRLAQDSAGRHGGSNMLPSEIMDAYHLRCDPQYDSTRYGCSDMHAVYSYDSTWGWAFTLDRWLRDGHDISEVDYVSSSARVSFFETEVSEQDFLGITGRVRHYPNGDRDGELQLFQIQGTNMETLASVVDQGKTFKWLGPEILWGGSHNHSFDPLSLSTGVSNLNGSLWPSDAPEVCGSPLQLVFDAEDVLGSERCEPCSGGQGYLWDDTLGKGRCLPCEMGSARLSGAPSPACTTCEVGKYANATGMVECLSCPGGHTCRRGSSVPSPCGLGFYAPYGYNDTDCLTCPPGQYANTEAMDTCQSCVAVIPGSTSPAASREASDCRCAEGFVLLTEGCSQCDAETMSCPGGLERQHEISAKKGFYLQGFGVESVNGSVPLLVKQPMPFRCASDRDCPGDMPPHACPLGHEGLVCAQCVDGYTRRGGECHSCVAQQARVVIILTLAIILFVVIVVGILRTATDPYKVCLTWPTAIGTTLGFLVTFVQLHQILGAMSVVWPDVFTETVLVFANLFTFNMEEGSTDCNALKGALGIFLPKLILYPMTLLALAILWCVGRKICPEGNRFLTTRGNTLTVDSLVNAMGLVTNVAFVPLAVHTTGILNCYSHPNPYQSMRMIPFMICGSPEWINTMLPAGITSLMLLVILPFALCVYLVCKATSMPNAVARLPFLMARFRPDAYWWGLTILSRNLALALAMIVAPTKPFVVAFLLMTITLVYLYAVLRHDPWKFHGHTVIDSMMSVAFALVLTVGVAFADTMTYPNSNAQEKSDTWWAVLAICGTMPFFVSLVAMVVCAYCGGRESQPAKQGQDAEDLYLMIKQTISTARPVFAREAGTEAEEIKVMLSRLTDLSAHDWVALKNACRILDALSLDKMLEGRFSSRRSGSRSSSTLAIDTEAVAKRISSRTSTSESDPSLRQVVVV